ncbi:MAG: glycogen debranching enzyme, partial [Cetobacterium sp.]
DWDRKEIFSDVFDFVKNMINFRKKHSILRRCSFFTEKDFDGNGYNDITWHGISPGKPDWSYFSKTLAFMIDQEDTEDNINNCSIYVALNSYHEDLDFQIPYLPKKIWYRVVDTSDKENSFLEIPELVSGKSYHVKSRSSIILIAKDV